MEVVRTRAFDRDIERIGASETDVEALAQEIMADPDRGDVIQGLGGGRKLRFALKSRGIGKRGGGRAIYVFVRTDEQILLLMAYLKNEKSNLSPRDRKVLKAVIASIEER